MKCIYHNDRDAEFVCSSCGQPVCRECITITNGKNVCRSCVYKNAQYNAQQQYNIHPYKRGDGINGFFFFVFMAVPGLRHMYLGLMKRGFEFLVAFFGAITLGFLLRNMGEIVMPIVFIIWFYSVFDSYQCRKLLSKGEKVLDTSIFEDYGLDQLKGFLGKRKKLVGTIIIFFGSYMFLRQLRWYLGRYIESSRAAKVIFDIIDFGFDSIVPIIFIAGGIYIISSVRKRESTVDEQS